MVSEIEKVSSRRSPEYDYLFEMGDRIEKNQQLDIETLLLEAIIKESKIQLGRKITYLDSRALVIDAQTAVSNEKADLFRQNRGLYLDSAAAVCSLTGAIWSAPAIGQGFSQAFSATSSHLDRGIKAQEEVFGHSYQRFRDVVGDNSQGMQSAEQAHKHALEMMERLVQTSRKQTELMAQ